MLRSMFLGGGESSDTTIRTTIRYVPSPSAAGNKPQPRQRRDRKRHCHRRASSPTIRPSVDSSVLGTGRAGPNVTNGGRSLTSRCRQRLMDRSTVAHGQLRRVGRGAEIRRRGLRARSSPLPSVDTGGGGNSGGPSSAGLTAGSINTG